MKWLVVLEKSADHKEVVRQLALHNCVVSSDPPQPLGDDEAVLSVDGPADLSGLKSELGSGIRIYPNSKQNAY